MTSHLAIGILASALSFGTPGHGPDGKAIFETHCRKCHGASGTPSAAMKKLLPELPLWDAKFFAQRTDDSIVRILVNGKGKNMKALRNVLTPDEMVAVAKYIRTLAR